LVPISEYNHFWLPPFRKPHQNSVMIQATNRQKQQSRHQLSPTSAIVLKTHLYRLAVSPTDLQIHRTIWQRSMPINSATLPMIPQSQLKVSSPRTPFLTLVSSPIAMETRTHRTLARVSTVQALSKLCARPIGLKSPFVIQIEPESKVSPAMESLLSTLLSWEMAERQLQYLLFWNDTYLNKTLHSPAWNIHLNSSIMSTEILLRALSHAIQTPQLQALAITPEALKQEYQTLSSTVHNAQSSTCAVMSSSTSVQSILPRLLHSASSPLIEN